MREDLQEGDQVDIKVSDGRIYKEATFVTRDKDYLRLEVDAEQLPMQDFSEIKSDLMQKARDQLPDDSKPTDVAARYVELKEEFTKTIWVSHEQVVTMTPSF